MKSTPRRALDAACVVTVLVACLAHVRAATASDSWATMPVAWQGGALSGQVSPSQAKTLAKFQQVVFNKRQGRDVPGQTAEEHITQACRQVKAVNPKTSCLMYLNTKLVFDNYAAAAALTTSELLHGSNGKLVEVPAVHGGPPSHVVDYTQPAVARQYISDVLNTTVRSRGALDGGFLDRFNYQDSAVDKPLSKSKAAAFHEGEKEAVSWLAGALPRGANDLYVHCDFIRPASSECRDIASIPAPAVTSECFWPTASAMALTEAAVGKAAAAGKLLRVEAKVNCTDEGQMASTVAAFLVSAGPNTMLMCGKFVEGSTDPGLAISWWPQWELPLGDPVGPTSKSGAQWSRKFASGASAVFDTRTQAGTVTWSDGTVTVGTPVQGKYGETCNA